MCIADWLISDKRRPSQWAIRKRQFCRYHKNCCLQYYLTEIYFLPSLQVKAWELYNKSFKPSRAPSPFSKGTYINSRYMFKLMSRCVPGTEAKAHGVCAVFLCLPISLLSFIAFSAFLLSSFLVPRNKILLICPMWKYIQGRTFEDN